MLGRVRPIHANVTVSSFPSITTRPTDRILIVPTVASETAHRMDLWRRLGSERDNLEPQALRDLGIYGGAQGIWVDKTRTAGDEIGPAGATVAILHTGRHYPDDLADDGMIYHYPTTSRHAGRDAAEVQATKTAMDLRLPIFVILPGKTSSAKRSVKLGWVSDFDDDNRQFLILFGTDDRPVYAKPEAGNSPFQLLGKDNRRKGTSKVRPGQSTFRFHVMSRYGQKCAVCEIRHPLLLIAAHICGKAATGSDDWRNGIPLCATHHIAFDNYLFAIDPDTAMISCQSGVIAIEIGLCEESLRTIKNRPHVEALKWRWMATQKVWNSGGEKVPCA